MNYFHLKVQDIFFLKSLTKTFHIIFFFVSLTCRSPKWDGTALNFRPVSNSRPSMINFHPEVQEIYYFKNFNPKPMLTSNVKANTVGAAIVLPVLSYR